MTVRLMGFAPVPFRAPENDEGFDHDEAEVTEGAGEDAEADDEGDEGFDDEDQSDQGEDHDDGEDEGQEDRSDQVAKPSRKEGRLAELARVSKEAKERAERAEQRLAEIERDRNQRQQQETQAQRAERLSMLSPDERTEYLLQEQAQNFQGQLNAIRFEAQNSADRTAFEALCARNPVAARHAAEVEAELTRLRSTGNNYARETVLAYLVGQKAIAGTSRAKGKQEREASANRQRQAARPLRSGSDVVSDSGRGGSEAQRRAKRLADMQI